MLAVALTAPSISWVETVQGQQREPAEWRRQFSALCIAMISSQSWGVLDFEGVDEKVASRLTDDDLHAIFVCIDANNTVKRLKLAGCINIYGSGLEPLRDSIILEQIDLSILGQNIRPTISHRPMISIDAAIPVLDSIVAVNGSSLKQIQLPHKWVQSEWNEALAEFLMRYNHLLDSRQFNCVGCVTIGRQDDCHGTYGQSWIRYPVEQGVSYETQRFTCYGCMGNFCQSYDEWNFCKCHYCEKR